MNDVVFFEKHRRDNLKLHLLIEKAASYKRLFQVFFLLLFSLSFVGIYTTKKKSGTTLLEREYDGSIQAFLKKQDFDEALFRLAQNEVKKYPSLTLGNEHKLIQHLFTVGASKKGVVLAKTAVKKMKEHAPYHAEFVQGTLLIQEEKLEDALTLSKKLEEKLRCDPSLWNGSDVIMARSSHLMAMNLLRIATLYKELDLREAELKALTALKEFIGNSSRKEVVATTDHQHKADFLAQFSVGSASLLDYIHAREKAL